MEYNSATPLHLTHLDHSVLEPSSVILDQLRSNRLPAEGDTEYMSSKIQEISRALKERNREISRLRALVAQLEMETDDLSGFLDHYQSFSAPIRKLPSELLIEILFYSFTWALTIDQSQRVPTLRLAQVCSFWRRLVLSSSCRMFWSSLYISLPRMSNKSLELVRLYLERSGNTPLTLHITDSALCFRLPRPGMETMVLLLDHCTRWRYLTFNACSSLVLNDLPSENNSVSFPELRSVEFINKFDFLLRYSSIADAFQSASQLCQLQLDSFPVPQVYQDYFPFSQLTTLVIRDNNCHMVDALFFCPRLQKLETSVHVIHALGCTSKEVVRHDSLRELILRFDTFISISGSLRTVQLPNLLSVELFSKSSPHAEFPSSGPASVRLGPNGHLSWLPDDFLFFLKNSACSLTSLSFRTFKLTDYDLGRIFELTPSLAHFSLREYGVSLGTGLLSSLTRSQENPIPLLPQLSHLEVHWHEHEHKPDDVLRLVAMVESRTHSKDVGFEGARMRKFALNFKYDLTQREYLVGSEFLSRMKALYVSDAVDVSLMLAGEPITLSSR